MTYAELVRFHGASNHWRLGELSGTTAVDSIGGANGVISGGVTLGQSGGVTDDKSILFNGTTGQILTAGNVSVPAIVTVEGWLKFPNANSFYPVFSTRHPDTTPGSFYTGIEASGGRLAIYKSTGNVIGTRIVCDGKWHHVVYIFDITNVNMYVDGVLDQTLASTRVALNQPIGIGYDSAAPGFYANGQIDEVAIYPRALTQAEISSHYSTGLTGNYVLTVQSIPIGPSVPVVAGQVYALPAVPVLMTAGAQVQTSLTMSGPYTNVPNGQVNGVYLKSASNTNVTLSKYVISS